MKKIKLNIIDDKDCGDIMINVEGASFQTDTFFDTTSIRFFVDDDTADKIVFHLGTILQDRERRAELKRQKAGEELREMPVLEKEAE